MMYELIRTHPITTTLLANANIAVTLFVDFIIGLQPAIVALSAFVSFLILIVTLGIKTIELISKIKKANEGSPPKESDKPS